MGNPKHYKLIVNPLEALSGHRDAVYALEQGNSDDCFYSSGADGLIIEWDFTKDEDGKVVARLPFGVYSLLYLPAHQLLIAGNMHGGIHALDLKENKQIWFFEANGSVFKLKEGKSGQIIAATGKGNLLLIDAMSGNELYNKHISEKSCRTLAVSPDGGMFAAGFSDDHIRVYQTETLDELYAWQAHNSSVFSLCWPTDEYLYSGSRDARLCLWEANQGFSKYMSVPAHWFAINDIAYNAPKGWLATASKDKTVKIWEQEGVTLLKVIDKEKFNAHTHSVNTLLWHKTGNILLSAGDDRKIRRWHIEKE